MNSSVPRLRMFAGPNGSGKSTLKGELNPDWLGFYVNADELEEELRKGDRQIDLGRFGIETTEVELRAFFEQSTLLANNDLLGDAQAIRLVENRLSLGALDVNSYHASVLVDFIRSKLVANRETVSFETVMSSKDKIEFFCRARQNGYRTYLYFVATDDPAINIARVALRVKQGGHPVPEEKVIQRYTRSLENLLDAIRCADRAYIFDNSGETLELLAEITDGKEIVLEVDDVPEWFNQAVLVKGTLPTEG